eukprot:RCo045965
MAEQPITADGPAEASEGPTPSQDTPALPPPGEAQATPSGPTSAPTPLGDPAVLCLGSSGASEASPPATSVDPTTTTTTATSAATAPLAPVSHPYFTSESASTLLETDEALSGAEALLLVGDILGTTNGPSPCVSPGGASSSSAPKGFNSPAAVGGGSGVGGTPSAGRWDG